ncbi:MAG: hypothetical protein P8J68_06745 [Arenicellaceae bacterium]|nr:hypothetical protein [Arenicellaceae bacterium]
MRFPIKLNQNYWPNWLCQLLPSMEDPADLLGPNLADSKFTRAVSAFKFGSTFKTTKRARFPLTIKALQDIDLASDAVVLDVGASDGVASLDAINSLRYSDYFVTDLNTKVGHIFHAEKHYFYDSNNHCILISSPRFIWYNELSSAVWPFTKLTNNTFTSAPDCQQTTCRYVSLFNPELTKNPNVTVQNHNLFEPWYGPKPNLIIAANILNRSYFSDIELNNAIDQLIQNLAGDGYIAIVDSRETERSSIFAVTTKKIELIKSINGGAETQSLVLSRQQN